MCEAAVGRGELSLPRRSFPTFVVHAAHLMFGDLLLANSNLRTALICASLHLSSYTMDQICPGLKYTQN